MGKNKRQYWDVTSDSLARGIRWAAKHGKHGARVINVSFSPAKGERSSTFDKAVSYAISKGSTVVISAGNGTGNNDKGTSNPAANSYAADNPGAIRVASADAWNSLSYFSNHGPRLADVAAFGEYVPVDSIDNNVSTGVSGGVSGTTVSAAVVSGIAGLLLSVHPELTPAQVKAIIMESCNGSGLDVPCGGVVSANRALIAAQNPPKSVYLRVKIGGVGKVALSGQAACTTANCRYKLVTGTLKLRATPTKADWQFDHWTGGISSKKATLSINMKAAKSIKAVFVRTKIKGIW
jgi:subtilisin family serine protease